MLIDFLKRNKRLLILGVAMIVAMLMLYIINIKPADSDYQIVLTSDATYANDEKSSDNKNSTSSSAASEESPTQEATDLKITNSLLESNTSRFNGHNAKDYQLLKQSGEYRLAKITIHNSRSGNDYWQVVIFKDSTVISGIINYYTPEKLQEQGVPDDIINLYVEQINDV